MKKMSHVLFLSIFIIIILVLWVYKLVFNTSIQNTQNEKVTDTIECLHPLTEEEIQNMYKGVQGDLSLEQVDSIYNAMANDSL